jgi:LuxR family transcriptional regulator, maltose regulon positive regulatory protein
VLRCLASGLSQREIGARLYISLNTVKTHTRELYRKLDVTSRADADAVALAEALGLLERTESPG